MRSPRGREIAAALRGAAGLVLEEDAAERASNVSASSTVATSTSLTSRLAALALDLEEAARKERDCEELGTFPEEEEEEEEVVEVSEEDVLRVLDAQEDPFQVGGEGHMECLDGWMDGWCVPHIGLIHLEHHVCLSAGVLSVVL